MADERNGRKVDQSEQTSQLLDKESLQSERDGGSIETGGSAGKVSKDRVKSTVKEEAFKETGALSGDAGVSKGSESSIGEAKVFKDQLERSSDSERSSSEGDEEDVKDDVAVKKKEELEKENVELKKGKADLEKEIEELKKKLKFFQHIEGTDEAKELKKCIDEVVEEFMNRK